MIDECNLRRYGNAADGAYVLCANLITPSHAAYSYGIGGYDPWGCAVSKRHQILVHQYDCFDLRRPVCNGGDLIFHEECLGPERTTIEGRPFDSFASYVAKNGDLGSSLLVKMDIEGSEVDSLLATPDSLLDAISQLVVEFHDVNDARYLDAIRKLKRHFFVADVHFNNYSCTSLAPPFPATVYEVLFVNKSLVHIADENGSPVFPNPAWRPNTPVLPDCQKRIVSGETVSREE
jgi:hypothetical protein